MTIPGLLTLCGLGHVNQSRFIPCIDLKTMLLQQTTSLGIVRNSSIKGLQMYCMMNSY